MIPKTRLTTKETETQEQIAPIAVMTATETRIFIHKLTDELFALKEMDPRGDQGINIMIYND